ncbi:hypothetical protein [Geobacillus kaustophilus]|uniref:hypothetical protein n=1 Tax=Geobacillus kaustophilus TaxID=1462 RepID=UPI0020CD2967|nr:hypothetical protein [Geobacillus kaustophilus]
MTIRIGRRGAIKKRASTSKKEMTYVHERCLLHLCQKICTTECKERDKLSDNAASKAIVSGQAIKTEE